MIYTSAKVNIKNYKASVDRRIVVYRGDKNVEVQFEIVENAFKQYKTEGTNVIYNLDASYGQLVVMKPMGEIMFTDIVPTIDGKVVFKMPEELMDEYIEVGLFTFQIRLYDESQTSRVTLPPVEEGIEVKEPIA